MNIPTDLVIKILSYSGIHETCNLIDEECPKCKYNYIDLVCLDPGSESWWKNLCSEDSTLKKLTPQKTDKRCLIYVVGGNPWPLVNRLKHRKFKFKVLGKNEVIIKKDVCYSDSLGTADHTKFEGFTIISGIKPMHLDGIDYIIDGTKVYDVKEDVNYFTKF